MCCCYGTKKHPDYERFYTLGWRHDMTLDVFFFIKNPFTYEKKANKRSANQKIKINPNLNGKQPMSSQPPSCLYGVFLLYMFVVKIYFLPFSYSLILWLKKKNLI